LIPDHHGQPLTEAELEQLAADIAARPELWEHHIDPTVDHRTYASLHRDASVDVWAIFWRPGNDTGWHDHDVSSGAVHVVEGTVVEHGLRLAGPEQRCEHGAGGGFTFGPSHIHRITCEEGTAVSIHTYSPPLWRLGQYAVDAEGTLTRQSVSYADELRPVAA
jgi:predicted metal-dependent enzyme (double-stranded beta helix superfamily)